MLLDSCRTLPVDIMIDTGDPFLPSLSMNPKRPTQHPMSVLQMKPIVPPRLQKRLTSCKVERGVSGKLRGTLFWCPYNKDPTI